MCFDLITLLTKYLEMNGSDDFEDNMEITMIRFVKFKTYNILIYKF